MRFPHRRLSLRGGGSEFVGVEEGGEDGGAGAGKVRGLGYQVRSISFRDIQIAGGGGGEYFWLLLFIFPSRRQAVSSSLVVQFCRRSGGSHLVGQLETRPCARL